MLFEPQITELRNHIDHYWIINDMSQLSNTGTILYAYPGITPDMIIVLDGHYAMHYDGKRHVSNRSRLFSFIHKELVIDFADLKKCVIIKFKSRGLSSVMPFLKHPSDDLMRNSVAEAEAVFCTNLTSFENHLLFLSAEETVKELDQWFFNLYHKEREGFVMDMVENISPSFDLKTIMETTRYSYSTMERYFKKETGLTPKAFQSLRRYKQAVRELYVTQNTDWQHYIDKYGYYDQSHFIRDIKRFTSFTPSQLLQTPAFIQIRPKYS